MCEKSDVFASACAAARAFPIFTRKTSIGSAKRVVTIEFLVVYAGSATEGKALSEKDLQCIRDAACGIRLAARLTDTPCAEMHTEAFVKVQWKHYFVHSLFYPRSLSFGIHHNEVGFHASFTSLSSTVNTIAYL